jgi:Na+-translocating ferredoxin:NAD+ oxidoreductase RnfA subunit
MLSICILYLFKYIMAIQINLDFVRLDVTRQHALKILNIYVCFTLETTNCRGDSMLHIQRDFVHMTAVCFGFAYPS